MKFDASSQTGLATLTAIGNRVRALEQECFSTTTPAETKQRAAHSRAELLKLRDLLVSGREVSPHDNGTDEHGIEKVVPFGPGGAY